MWTANPLTNSRSLDSGVPPTATDTATTYLTLQEAATERKFHRPKVVKNLMNYANIPYNGVANRKIVQPAFGQWVPQRFKSLAERPEEATATLRHVPGWNTPTEPQPGTAPGVDYMRAQSALQFQTAPGHASVAHQDVPAYMHSASRESLCMPPPLLHHNAQLPRGDSLASGTDQYAAASGTTRMKRHSAIVGDLQAFEHQAVQAQARHASPARGSDGLHWGAAPRSRGQIEGSDRQQGSYKAAASAAIPSVSGSISFHDNQRRHSSMARTPWGPQPGATIYEDQPAVPPQQWSSWQAGLVSKGPTSAWTAAHAKYTSARSLSAHCISSHPIVVTSTARPTSVTFALPAPVDRLEQLRQWAQATLQCLREWLGARGQSEASSRRSSTEERLLYAAEACGSDDLDGTDSEGGASDRSRRFPYGDHEVHETKLQGGIVRRETSDAQRNFVAVRYRPSKRLGLPAVPSDMSIIEPGDDAHRIRRAFRSSFYADHSRDGGASPTAQPRRGSAYGGTNHAASPQEVAAPSEHGKPPAKRQGPSGRADQWLGTTVAESQPQQHQRENLVSGRGRQSAEIVSASTTDRSRNSGADHSYHDSQSQPRRASLLQNGLSLAPFSADAQAQAYRQMQQNSACIADGAPRLWRASTLQEAAAFQNVHNQHDRRMTAQAAPCSSELHAQVRQQLLSAAAHEEPILEHKRRAKDTGLSELVDRSPQSFSLKFV